MTNSKSISRRTLVSAAAAGTAALGAAFTQQARALPASEVKAWDYEADVVVCGCGTGGSAAAVEAYDQGADVLVIEKKDWLGGQMRRCGGGVCGAGTKVQKALGVEDDPESFYQYWLATTNGFCDPELVKAFCYNSAALVDWLIDDLGGQPVDQWAMNGGDDGLTSDVGPGLNIGVDPELMKSYGAEPIARCHWFTENPDDEFISDDHPQQYFPTPGGTGLWKIFDNALAERGIEPLRETSLTRLVTKDGSNEVVGIVAEKDGGEVCIKARKGVVICTGNWASNHDMHYNFSMHEYADGGETCGPDLPGDNDGSGVKAALALGADLMYPATDSCTAYGFMSYMCGGLKIDTDAQAIDVFGEKIPRLFVSSIAAGGLVAVDYPVCGASIGRCLYFGRVAGANAAALESWA